MGGGPRRWETDREHRPTAFEGQRDQAQRGKGELKEELGLRSARTQDRGPWGGTAIWAQKKDQGHAVQDLSPHCRWRCPGSDALRPGSGQAVSCSLRLPSPGSILTRCGLGGRRHVPPGQAVSGASQHTPQSPDLKDYSETCQGV